MVNTLIDAGAAAWSKFLESDWRTWRHIRHEFFLGVESHVVFQCISYFMGKEPSQ